MNDLSDEALMRCYQSGDTDAFDRLFVRHARDLYLTLCGLLGQEDGAIRLSSQTWQRAHQRRHAFTGQPPFRLWLFALAAELHREHARTLPITASQPGDLRPVLDANSLLHALAALPVSYREVFVLHHYAGLSFPEIAAALRASPAAVQQRAEQAQQLLISSLGKLPDKVLLKVAPTSLDHIARSVLPIVSLPAPTKWPLPLVVSCLLFGLGLVFFVVRLHH